MAGRVYFCVEVFNTYIWLIILGESKQKILVYIWCQVLGPQLASDVLVITN
jgi:hypothetical protein